MQLKSIAGVVAGLVAVAVVPAAQAAPVTVDLRVEGPTRTLIEQSVTVNVRPFKFSTSPATYQCDGTQANSGTATTAQPTRGGAIAQAAEQAGVELTGSFSQSLGSPSFDRVNGESVAYDASVGQFGAYLAEYRNGKAASLGSCGDPVADGDDVLFAYGEGSEPLLHLTGPATVKPGERATLVVTDESTSQAVAGAAAGGATSGADGRITTGPLSARGPQTFKATKAGAIRSNAVAVCVTDGADGFCGSPPAAPAAPAVPLPPVADTVAAFAKIGSIAEGRRFARGKGPRTITGKVDPEPAGLKDVRIRLARTSGSRCTVYDGTAERFVKAKRCGVKNARTFSLGTTPSFSYLLPSALPAGRYVLDAVVLDKAGNQTTTYQRGRNRVVFVVA